TTPTMAASPVDAWRWSNATSSGCSSWHGMHQLAKKLTTTNLPLYVDRSTCAGQVPPTFIGGPAVAGAVLPTNGLSAWLDWADLRVASSATKSSTTAPIASAIQRAVCPPDLRRVGADGCSTTSRTDTSLMRALPRARVHQRAGRGPTRGR